VTLILGRTSNSLPTPTQTGRPGLKVSTKKSKLFKMNHLSDAPIILHGSEVIEANEFTYLGSKMATHGEFGPAIETRLSKAE